MFRKKKKKRPEISAPQNFEHRVHTSFDPKEGKFVGLPPQWQNILDTLRRPKPVVDPSRITRMQLQPMKVREGGGLFFPVPRGVASKLRHCFHCPMNGTKSGICMEFSGQQALIAQGDHNFIRNKDSRILTCCCQC